MLITPAMASEPYWAAAPSRSTSIRSIAAVGIAFKSTPTVPRPNVPLTCTSAGGCRRLPLTSTSTWSGPRPRRLAGLMWSEPSAMVWWDALNDGASVARIWFTSVWPVSCTSWEVITSTGTGVSTAVRDVRAPTTTTSLSESGVAVSLKSTVTVCPAGTTTRCSAASCPMSRARTLCAPAGTLRRYCPFSLVRTLRAVPTTTTLAPTSGATESGAPLVGASVVVVGTARSVLTNEKGQYRLSVPAGAHSVRARLIGYEAAEERVVVPAGQTVTVDFKLTATPLSLNEIVVVGARTSRTAVETPVPVDVITSQAVQETGHTEVNQILATLAPSFNASHQTIADGSDHINPASLRGLGPDQVLVLVNGKRRHSSALVHVNGTFGRGTVGVDLNAIPTAAIDRIEVLRDGASEQYGSDAIAGVINIVLKQQAEHLDLTTTAGTTAGGKSVSDIASQHDGDQIRTEVDYGFKVGDRGFFNVAAEYLDRGATSRAAPYTGNDIFLGVTTQAGTDSALAAHGLTRQDFTIRLGQAAATEGMAFYNTVVPLSENAEFYSFGGVSHRNGVAAGFYRLPSQEARVVPQLYPFGFLPEIRTILDDNSGAAGVRGALNGWDVDFSVTHGTNALHYFVEHSDNASMGTASPTTFDAGRLGFGQTLGSLDVVRPLDIRGGLRSLSFVAGGEFRGEEYRIEPGDEASWQLGNGGSLPGKDFDTTSAGKPKESGAQVFPGFQPANELDRSRNSVSVYGGLESQVSERFLVDVGGRLESYSDFGRTFNWKVASRFEVAPHVAVRGAASTGFRAPSLAQVWFNNVSNQFAIDASGNLILNRILTSNNQSRVTQAFGIRTS